jgi:hypothetical protein
MARWKILTPHYLNSPGVDWEYMEINRRTMRQERRKFDVPLLIHPEDPSCWTSRWGPQGQEEGECIVCQVGKGLPGDIEFLGDPTPDMIPVDAEAEEISKSFAARWKAGPETLFGDYSQSVLAKLQDQLVVAQTQPASTKVEGLDDLVGTIGDMMRQNQQILAALVSSQHPPRAPERRV